MLRAGFHIPTPTASGHGIRSLLKSPMHGSRARAWFALLCCSTVFVLCVPSLGTTFVPLNEVELASQSVAVVVGWVTRIQSAVDEQNDGVRTYVTIVPTEIIAGALPAGQIVLREEGGEVSGHAERIFGSPEYSVGEHVLVFLSQNQDGTLRTTEMAMGKYTVGQDSQGILTVTRTFGEGVAVLDPNTGQLAIDTPPETTKFDLFVARVQAATLERPSRAPIILTPPEITGTTLHEYERASTYQEAFTYLGSPPARWFEPDSGLPVFFDIDSTGDATLGLASSRSAADSALAVWTNVPTSGLILEDGGLTSPVAYAGCTGPNRIIFNDPANEITDPVNCGGILAIGGYCSTSQTTTVNGTVFNRIVLGKVTFNNGWQNCAAWTVCNVAEVATHELGHSIGLGHSTDPNATMYATAHFDGRCAGLGQDDINAVTFIYPALGTPVPSATPTSTPSATPTPVPSNTKTATATWTPSGTPTATRIPTLTATRASTATHTPTVPPTLTPTWTGTWTPTSTQTPTQSQTETPTATQTPPPTDTATPFPSPTVMVGLSGHVRYYASGLPVNAAAVHLESPVATTTQTDVNGQYAFTGMGGTMWQIQPQKTGDEGTAVSALDAVYALQAAAGLRTLDADQRMACDVNGSGGVTALDAAYILQYRVGLISQFPASLSCGSDWLFVPVPVVVPDQQLVQPSPSSGTCQAGEILINPLVTNVSGQDFAAILLGDCSGNWQPNTAADTTLSANAKPAIVRVGRPLRGRTMRVRVPLSVASATRFNALDVHLRYTATRLQPVRVRTVGVARDALVQFNVPSPGRFAIALASATPMVSRGNVLLIVEFAGRGHLKTIRPVDAAVDDQPAIVSRSLR